MQWIDSKQCSMRGDIESREDFVKRNMYWWNVNKNFERVRRRPYYLNFLKYCGLDIETKYSYIGEVGPGPFGGILEVCKIQAIQKYFIDYVLRELVALKFVRWPDDGIYVHAPAEKIPLMDNALDVLLSFNAVDHGWNIYDVLKECIRISKRCYIAFDCRGDNPNEVEKRHRQSDLDHYQLLKFKDMKSFVESELNKIAKISFEDMKIKKEFPVALLRSEK